MRIFLTGGTGYVGPAVIRELQRVGHEVLGLARSSALADALIALGADVHRGSLAEALEIYRRALMTLGDVLAGSDSPLVSPRRFP